MEVLAEGADPNLDALQGFLEQGPELARVDRVLEKEADSALEGVPAGFQVR